MIQWGPGQKQRIRSRDGTPSGRFHHWQDSASPTGYWIIKIPHRDNLPSCTLRAMHEAADGRVTFIGEVRDLPDRDFPAKEKAAASLRAACDEHLARISSAG